MMRMPPTLLWLLGPALHGLDRGMVRGRLGLVRLRDGRGALVDIDTPTTLLLLLLGSRGGLLLGGIVGSGGTEGGTFDGLD
jgi:hypothetical protein